jgi:hypothetical protein
VFKRNSTAGSFQQTSFRGASGPQPHRNFIEVLCETSLDYRTWTVEGAGEDARKELKGADGSNGLDPSWVKIALTQETEAVKVVVTNDEWTDDDPAYLQNAYGWRRILPRLKALPRREEHFGRIDRRADPTESGFPKESAGSLLEFPTMLRFAGDLPADRP